MIVPILPRKDQGTEETDIKIKGQAYVLLSATSMTH
jgi:hypothetical protein